MKHLVFSERKLSRSLKNKEKIVENVLIKKKKKKKKNSSVEKSISGKSVYHGTIRYLTPEEYSFIHCRYVSINGN